MMQGAAIARVNSGPGDCNYFFPAIAAIISSFD
jgi:hypothetical protein